MKIPKFKLYTSVICVALLLPNLTLAYLTTDQTATKLNNNTVLYTISYKFGFLNRDLHMPMGATRDTATTSPYVAYRILNGELTSSAGEVSSFVLTSDEDVQIKDNQYFLPRGKNAIFTLVTIFTIPDDEKNELADFSQIISSLPFTMVDNGKATPARLNPSELQYYRTPGVKF